MKNVDGVYEIDSIDMNPFSEYVHSEKKNEIIPQEVLKESRPTFTKEVAMKNFKEMLEGIDTMTYVMDELVKRIRR